MEIPVIWNMTSSSFPNVKTHLHADNRYIYVSSSSCHWIRHSRVSSHFCTHWFIFVSSLGPAIRWWVKLG